VGFIDKTITVLKVLGSFIKILIVLFELMRILFP